MDLKRVAIWVILIVGGTLYFGWWYFVIMGVFLERDRYLSPREVKRMVNS